MDMQIATCCGCSYPVRDGLAIALVLSLFIPLIYRSHHRAEFLGVFAVIVTLSTLSTTLSILTFFAEDDVPFIAGTTAAIADLAFLVKLIRTVSAPSRHLALKRLC
jgi:hypothetical protein